MIFDAYFLLIPFNVHIFFLCKLKLIQQNIKEMLPFDGSLNPHNLNKYILKMVIYRYIGNELMNHEIECFPKELIELFYLFYGPNLYDETATVINIFGKYPEIPWQLWDKRFFCMYDYDNSNINSNISCTRITDYAKIRNILFGKLWLHIETHCDNGFSPVTVFKVKMIYSLTNKNNQVLKETKYFQNMLNNTDVFAITYVENNWIFQEQLQLKRHRHIRKLRKKIKKIERIQDTIIPGNTIKERHQELIRQRPQIEMELIQFSKLFSKNSPRNIIDEKIAEIARIESENRFEIGINWDKCGVINSDIDSMDIILETVGHVHTSLKCIAFRLYSHSI